MKTFLQILKLIPFLFVTVFIFVLWNDDFVGFMLALLYFWIILPLIVLSIVFFFMGLRRRNKWQWAAVIWGGVNLLLFVLYIFVQAPNQRCDPDIMAEHYDKHHIEMEELHSYLKSVVADSTSLLLEFDGSTPALFQEKKHGTIFATRNWDDETPEYKQRLLLRAGLSQDEFEGIRKRLKNMGCIGIEYSQSMSERLSIWFRRVDMGVYSYNIYSRPMTDEEKNEVMEHYEYIPYNDHCVFEYGGGAFGPQTFGAKLRKDFLSHHQPW